MRAASLIPFNTDGNGMQSVAFVVLVPDFIPDFGISGAAAAAADTTPAPVTTNAFVRGERAPAERDAAVEGRAGERVGERATI